MRDDVLVFLEVEDTGDDQFRFLAVKVGKEFRIAYRIIKIRDVFFSQQFDIFWIVLDDDHFLAHRFKLGIQFFAQIIVAKEEDICPAFYCRIIGLSGTRKKVIDDLQGMFTTRKEESVIFDQIRGKDHAEDDCEDGQGSHLAPNGSAKDALRHNDNPKFTKLSKMDTAEICRFQVVTALFQREIDDQRLDYQADGHQ